VLGPLSLALAAAIAVATWDRCHGRGASVYPAGGPERGAAGLPGGADERAAGLAAAAEKLRGKFGKLPPAEARTLVQAHQKEFCRCAALAPLGNGARRARHGPRRPGAAARAARALGWGLR
jgi:hypothetical protein